MPLADVYRTRIFEPLGMAETALWTSEPERLATAYAPTPTGLQVFDPADGKWTREPRFGDAAADLLSTVDDLHRFARMLLEGGGAVLGRESVRAMTTDQLRPGQAERDGAGFLSGRSWSLCQSVVVDGPRAGAFGWDGGFGSSWLVDPVRDLVVIVLTQRLFGDPLAPPVHTDLQDAAYAALA